MRSMRVWGWLEDWLKSWLERQPKWLQILIIIFWLLFLGCISHYAHYVLLFPLLLYEFIGAQLMIVLVIIILALILSSKYTIDTLGGKLDRIGDTLEEIAHKMGVESRKETRSPGYVYVDCRWLRISREHVKDDVHHVYVYCAHPKKPMTEEGCPYNCGYLDTSDRKTGAGAFTGLVLGGIAGLPAGPPGVIIGGLLGALVGDMLEVAKPVEAKIRSLRDRGISYELHIDVSKLSSD